MSLMRNDIRNSIVLASLLIVILLLNFGLSYHTNKKIKLETEKLNKNKSELQSMSNIVIDTMQVYYIKQQISKMDSWQARYGKTFMLSDNSRQSWSYISSIVNSYCPDLDVNFESLSDVAEENVNRDYKISGTANIQTFYLFMNQLENQSPLYIVREFSLNQSTQQQEDGTKQFLVNFDLTIQSQVNPSGKEISENRFRSLNNKVVNNFFAPGIYSPYENPSEADKIDAEKAILLSLTPSTAFIKAADGHVYIIKQGAKVAYGYLHSINWKDQSVTFKLNKIGVFRDVTIKLNKE